MFAAPQPTKEKPCKALPKKKDPTTPKSKQKPATWGCGEPPSTLKAVVEAPFCLQPTGTALFSLVAGLCCVFAAKHGATTKP